MLFVKLCVCAVMVPRGYFNHTTSSVGAAFDYNERFSARFKKESDLSSLKSHRSAVKVCLFRKMFWCEYRDGGEGRRGCGDGYVEAKG